MTPLRDVVAQLAAGSRELARLDDQIGAQLREIEARLRGLGVTRVHAVKLPDGAELAWSGHRTRRSGRDAHWRLVIRDADGAVVDLVTQSSREERCEAITSGALGRLVQRLMTEAA